MFSETHPLRHDDTEAVKEHGLVSVGLSDAPQADLAMHCGGQHHVVRLEACKFFENGTRGVAEASTALPHLQALPQHEGQKADENMCLHAILALVPDRTQIQLIFLDAEGGLGLGQLDVSLPELLIGPVLDVRTQKIGALPMARRSMDLPLA